MFFNYISLALFSPGLCFSPYTHICLKLSQKETRMLNKS